MSSAFQLTYMFEEAVTDLKRSRLATFELLQEVSIMEFIDLLQVPKDGTSLSS